MEGDDIDKLQDDEDILKRHRQEKKDLQSKVQSMKKSIPKGDKKKRKEVTEEIAKLECELEEKHQQELSTLNKVESNIIDNNSAADECLEDVQDAEDSVNHSRVSRAQKRRNKKESEAREREKRIIEQSEKNKEGPRNLEITSIKQALKSMNLKLYNIPADGNCLYLAVNHQLQVTNRPTHSVNELRKTTSEFIRINKDEFLPFMCNESDESEIISEEQFENYCKEIATTKLWGGQLEIRALSNILKCPIKVIQANSPATLQGENYKSPELILTYHRHLYRLGEHYNSTLPVTGDDS